MDFDLPGDDDPRRRAVRDWLGAHPAPSGADLAAAGYVAPHWPRPYGLDADPLHQIVIDEELRRAGVRRPSNPIGIGWAGPTLLHAGTEEQKARWLPRILSGEDTWCQLFSEPGAGSDLASLTTRAVRDGDEWVVDRARRCGPRSPSGRGGASSSPAPTPTSPTSRASRTSCARWTPPASRSVRSSR